MVKGYIRIRALRYFPDTDSLFEEFCERKFHMPKFPPGTKEEWFLYQAHIFLMEKSTKFKELFLRLYVELIDDYPFTSIAIINQYKRKYPKQLFFFRDYYLTFLRTLCAEGGYPHRILCYCYRYFLNGYSSLKIASELSPLILDDLMKTFIKKYVTESCIPKFFVDYYFTPVKRDLNKVLNELIQVYSSNDAHFHNIVINIIGERTGSTKLESYFESVEPNRRSHAISVWNNRMTERIMKRTLSFLNDPGNYKNKPFKKPRNKNL